MLEVAERHHGKRSENQERVNDFTGEKHVWMRVSFWWKGLFMNVGGKGCFNNGASRVPREMFG